MLKKICFFLVLVLTVSCGSITLTPRGCQTKGDWKNEQNITPVNEELRISESYYVNTDDEEVKLKDILQKNNLKCDQIKTIRVKILSSFFIKRTIEIYYTTYTSVGM